MESTTDRVFDDPRSRESEELAFRAEVLERRGNQDLRDLAEARQLFARAAALEEAVVADIPSSSPRVKRVLAISAVALWLRANEHCRASDLAVRYIADGLVTDEDLVEMVDAQMAAEFATAGEPP
jgi:hypothetical protein